MHLTVAERKVMDVVWSAQTVTAKEIAGILMETAKWSKTTSYTMITRCIEKGYLLRQDPHFVCKSNISAEEVARLETEELLQNNFGGDATRLVEFLKANYKLPE